MWVRPRIPRSPGHLILCLQDKLLEAFMWVSQSSEDGEMIPRSSQHIETRFRPRPDPDFVSWAELDLCGEICHWSPQSLPVDDSELPGNSMSADCAPCVCVCSTMLVM